MSNPAKDAMKPTTIWFCEDLQNMRESGFGRTKHDAQDYVANNLGYGTFAECRRDDWAKPAIKIVVPYAAALVLIDHCNV